MSQIKRTVNLNQEFDIFTGLLKQIKENFREWYAHLPLRELKANLELISEIKSIEHMLNRKKETIL